ncbi:MAG: Ig-like domain-containing protein [Carboxydocellales bacterium]
MKIFNRKVSVDKLIHPSGLQILVNLIALALVLVLTFTWFGFSEAIINPQTTPNITVYEPGNLNEPVSGIAAAYPYYQGQVVKLDLDINPVLAAHLLLPSVVEAVYGDFSAVGGPNQFPLSSTQEGLYNLEYQLTNLTQTGNFRLSFQGVISGGGDIDLGNFEIYANKVAPTTLTGPEGTLGLKVLPDFSAITNFTAVPGVVFEVYERGKISLLAPVNFLTGGFMDTLDNLNSGLLLHAPNRAGLNSQLLSGLNVPAMVELYGVKLVEGIAKPGIIQLDDDGSLVPPGSSAYHLNSASVTYNQTAGTVNFVINGFSSYAIDPGLQVTTESHLIETKGVTIEGYVEDLSSQVAVYVYQETNLAGNADIDPVTGHFSFEVSDLVDGINPIWVKANNGGVTTTWDAKPKSTAIDPLQILVDTNGIIEEGLSTKDTDIVVEAPLSFGVTRGRINSFNQNMVEFYGHAPAEYRVTVYHQSQPLATSKSYLFTREVYEMPPINLSVLPEGINDFEFKAFDTKGYESDPINFSINKDTRPPTDQPLILDPENNFTTADAQPTFSGTLPANTTDDVADVRIYSGSTLISVGAVYLDEKTWFVRPALPLIPGSYEFYLVLTDQAGNESSATPLPAINILQPKVRTPEDY